MNTSETSSRDNDDPSSVWSVLAVSSFKKRTIGPLIRNAVALNFQHLAVIGSSTYSTHGAHGSQTKIRISYFYTWQEFF